MPPSLNIAVIGNSHVAALRMGWSLIQASFPTLQLRFYASRGAGLSALRADRNEARVTPCNESVCRDIAYTSGGDGSIRLATVDLCIICGLDLPGRYWWGDEDHLSSNVLHALFVDRAASAALQVLDTLRQVSDVPVLLAHVPFTAATDDLPVDPDTWTTQYQQGLDLANQIVFEPRRALLVPQPHETLGGAWSTRSCYSRGSRRLDIGDAISNELHEAEDVIHMNADYGAAWLNQTLSQWLRCLTG